MMRPLLLWLAVLAGGVGCRTTAYEPREGDLFFRVAGTAAASSAIAEATAWNDTLRFSHVAMVVFEEGTPFLLEATGESGVCCTAWDDFLAASPSVGGGPGVVVMRMREELRKEVSLTDAAARARSHLGEPYDWWYLPDNGRMYCSELVCDSYLKADGTRLFSLRPMNFRTADGELPAYWKALFEQLGTPVPEGLPGSNPNDLAKESSLIEVFRFF